MRSLVLAPAAFAVALAGPACGSKKEPPAEPARAASGSAQQPAPAPPPAPAPADGMPTACSEYRATIDRLAQCGEGMPQETRDALKAGFERDWAGWQKQGSAAAELEAACKRAADNVKVAASAACGW